MEVILKGDGKEIADFVLELQSRQTENYYGVMNKGTISCHNLTNTVEDGNMPKVETSTLCQQ